MKASAFAGVVATVFTLSAGFVLAQSASSAAAPHVAAAKAAAGTDQLVLFNQLCVPPPAAAPRPQPAAQPAAPQGPPPRSQWHAEPAKVFDNRYFVGMTEYTAWAVT